MIPPSLLEICKLPIPTTSTPVNLVEFDSGQTRMKTARQNPSRFVCVAPLQSEMRNGMEEVVGSIPIPIRSTSPSEFEVTSSGRSTRTAIGSCGSWQQADNPSQAFPSRLVQRWVCAH